MNRTKAIQTLINKLITKRGEEAVAKIEGTIRNNLEQYDDDKLNSVLASYNCV